MRTDSTTYLFRKLSQSRRQHFTPTVSYNRRYRFELVDKYQRSTNSAIDYGVLSLYEAYKDIPFEISLFSELPKQKVSLLPTLFRPHKDTVIARSSNFCGLN